MPASTAPRLLVVHDLPEVRDKLRRDAESHGFRCHAVGTAAEAHREILSFKPHVAVIDWQLTIDTKALIKRINWPSPVMRSHLLESGLDNLGLLRYIRSSEGRRFGYHVPFSKHVRGEDFNGIVLSNNLLDEHPDMRVVIVSGAQPEELNDALNTLVDKKHAEKVTGFPLIDTELASFFRMLKQLSSSE